MENLPRSWACSPVCRGFAKHAWSSEFSTQQSIKLDMIAHSYTARFKTSLGYLRPCQDRCRLSWHRITHTSSSQSMYHDIAISVYIFLLFFSFFFSPSRKCLGAFHRNTKWEVIPSFPNNHKGDSFWGNFLLRKCYLHLGPHFSMTGGAGRKTVKASSQKLVTLQECVEYTGLFVTGA